MRKRAIWLLLLLPAFLLMLSCRTTAPLAPEEPMVVLLSPGDGATLSGGNVQVRIYVENFSLVESTGQPNGANEGHAIYYLDVSAPLVSATPATTQPGTFVASAENSYTWQNVPPGQHTFTVQLVNNDDTPLNPPVTVRANVTVKNR